MNSNRRFRFASIDDWLFVVFRESGQDTEFRIDRHGNRVVTCDVRRDFEGDAGFSKGGRTDRPTFETFCQLLVRGFP